MKLKKNGRVVVHGCLTDTLLADLQSSTTGLKHHCAVTVDAWCVDADSESAMASRLSTDTLDSEGQVRVTVYAATAAHYVFTANWQQCCHLTQEFTRCFVPFSLMSAVPNKGLKLLVTMLKLFQFV